MDGNVMTSERNLLSKSNVLLVVGALISPWLLCQVWILTSAGDVAFETMPECETDSGNCAHLGGGADYRMDPLTIVIDAPIEDVKSNLDAYIDENSGDVLSTDSTATSHYVHFVERTSFWRFPDDVAVGLTAEGDDTTRIELHSASRLGQGDLGVNPERLEGLHAALLG